MIEFKNASADMVGDVAKLCNFVFRKTETPDHNDMHLQFPFLLSEDNANNLMVAVDGEKIVSHIGTSLTPMIIDGVEIPYGQIGAVCTHPDYRGQGLGTKLLFNAFENFKANDVNFITISGGRGLYRRNGAVDLGCVGMFEIEPSAVGDSACEIEFYKDGQIGLELIDVY
ncbi:MAG: GNAT family N-acetyltransferase, partial [Kiritimatiellae bacterium]|nr:GNAT family N-acetyltransferase [Kiritimatiellia bacterium]